jgi:D-glycero-D-manno-heptose 1,7-bisphosphate phosphatase
MIVRQAVFLVGGKGTRLGALTEKIPKPLLEISPGVRFLDVVLEEAARHGFTDLVLLAGHLGDQVEAVYQHKTIYDARVSVVREDVPQGTGGALRFAADRLAPWFLMGNGDTLFQLNLRDFALPLGRDALARIALREVSDPSRYGSITLSGNRITRFNEKTPDLVVPSLVNGGLYMMSSKVLEHISGPCSIETELFPKLAAENALEGRRYSNYFLDIGLPDTYAQARAEVPKRRHRPAAFLDRDGTLTKDDGYTHQLSDLALLPGAAQAVRELNNSGYFVVLVTNQAGVAHGLYPEAQVHVFNAALSEALAKEGAHIDAVYYCPYHSQAKDPRYRITNHPDRKPNPGMIARAAADWPINLSRSFLIGDSDTDMAAAANAGISSYRVSADRGVLEAVFQAISDFGRID